MLNGVFKIRIFALFLEQKRGSSSVHPSFILRYTFVIPSFILRLDIIKVKKNDAWNNVVASDDK